MRLLKFASALLASVIAMPALAQEFWRLVLVGDLPLRGQGRH